MRPLLPIREHFNEPELRGPAWTVTKGRRRAACQVWSHQFGFELRLLVSGDDLPRTQVVCSQEDLIRVQEEWRSALEAKAGQNSGADSAEGRLQRCGAVCAATVRFPSSLRCESQAAIPSDCDVSVATLEMHSSEKWRV
jgi:hypothetical protein